MKQRDNGDEDEEPPPRGALLSAAPSNISDVVKAGPFSDVKAGTCWSCSSSITASDKQGRGPLEAAIESGSKGNQNLNQLTSILEFENSSLYILLAR